MRRSQWTKGEEKGTGLCWGKKRGQVSADGQELGKTGNCGQTPVESPPLPAPCLCGEFDRETRKACFAAWSKGDLRYKRLLKFFLNLGNLEPKGATFQCHIV